MKILLTGADGFIGRNLNKTLNSSGYYVRCVTRKKHNKDIENTDNQSFIIDDICKTTEWNDALNGIDTVIHLAARVHVMQEHSLNILEKYREVNTSGTEKLASDAIKAGVKRFIYISTIKINGEETSYAPFTENDEAAPVDPYAISKWEAEQILQRISNTAGLEVIIIRPPLVYGPGVKGNFYNMLRWVNRGVPLPLGAVKNRRSLVALDNLVDLIITCIKNPAAANQTFLVSDDVDLSTTELLHRLGDALGRPARLFPIPMGLLKAGAAFVGKQDIAKRLLGSLQVDITKAKTLLGWTPPLNVDEGLKRTAHWYLQKLMKN